MFQPNAQVANLIRGLNKSASNIVIADNAQLKGQARFICKAKGPKLLDRRVQRRRGSAVLRPRSGSRWRRAWAINELQAQCLLRRVLLGV